MKIIHSFVSSCLRGEFPLPSPVFLLTFHVSFLRYRNELNSIMMVQTDRSGRLSLIKKIRTRMGRNRPKSANCCLIKRVLVLYYPYNSPDGNGVKQMDGYEYGG